MENKLEKKDYVSSFTLVGKAILTDTTFKMNQHSKKSKWIYNSMNIGIDCGEKHGVLYAEMMGGYSENGNSILYAHGKKEDGSDDFKARCEIAWEDRLKDSVIEDIGDMSFITVGLEKTDKDKTFYKKFLSQYDAIEYIKENLKDGMSVNVKGNLKYSEYNGNVQVRREITSFVLSSMEEENYHATFKQTILLTKDSIGSFDKEKNALLIYAKVLEYTKEINGIAVGGYKDGKPIGGLYPYSKTFEYVLPENASPELLERIKDVVFKVKKNVTQISFEGEFIEGGAVINITEDMLPDDIKDLIAIGAYSLEEALSVCADKGTRDRRMILKKPIFKKVTTEDGETINVQQKFPNRFEESDLILDCMKETNVSSETVSEAIPTNGLDWLNNVK